MANPRSTSPEPPFCWQNKMARRLIREKMNGEATTCALLSLYDALTEIASNEGKETFSAGQPYIGEIAGMSARNVRRLEPILEQIGVVTITRPPLRGHHTYSLLSLGHNVPSLGQDVLTLGQSEFHPTCPPVEEHKKNREGDMSDSSNQPHPRRSTVIDDLHIQSLKTIYNPSDVDAAVAKFKAWLLTPRGKGKLFTKRRLNSFLKDARPVMRKETAIEPERNAIDPDAFKAWVAVEFPNNPDSSSWTSQTADIRTIREFLASQP